MKRFSIPIVGLAAAACLALPPASGAEVFVVTTNQAGQFTFVASTNAPQIRLSPFLPPDTAARVYTSMLDSHMEATRRGWVNPETAAGQYRWLEEQLIHLTIYAPLSDWEREVMRARESQLRARVSELERQLAAAREEIRRREAEISVMIDRLRDRTPPQKEVKP